jgi:hypothetical protein
LERCLELHSGIEGQFGDCVTAAGVPVSIDILGLQIEHQAGAGSNDLNLYGRRPCRK